METGAARAAQVGCDSEVPALRPPSEAPPVPQGSLPARPPPLTVHPETSSPVLCLSAVLPAVGSTGETMLSDVVVAVSAAMVEVCRGCRGGRTWPVTVAVRSRLTCSSTFAPDLSTRHDLERTSGGRRGGLIYIYDTRGHCSSRVRAPCFQMTPPVPATSSPALLYGGPAILFLVAWRLMGLWAILFYSVGLALAVLWFVGWR